MTSDKHKRLVSTGIKWLMSQGFEDIEVEVKVLKAATNGYYAIDIIARKTGAKVALECGGSNCGKLDEMLGFFTAVWILPYGESEPYKWREGLSLCVNCGHVMGL